LHVRARLRWLIDDLAVTHARYRRDRTARCARTEVRRSRLQAFAGVAAGACGGADYHAQKLLGHATVEMTARVYTHLGEEQMRAAIDRIQTVSQPASPSYPAGRRRTA
jgi:integrase